MSEAIDLTGFDYEYQQAEAAETYVPPPPGVYKARITEAKFGQVGEKMQTMLLWTLRIVEGDLADRRVLFNSSLSSGAMPFLKGNLKIVGINVDRVSAVPALLPGVIGAVVEINVRKSGEYTNVDFTKLISGTSAATPPPAAAPAPTAAAQAPAPATAPIPDDDIPF